MQQLIDELRHQIDLERAHNNPEVQEKVSNLKQNIKDPEFIKRTVKLTDAGIKYSLLGEKRPLKAMVLESPEAMLVVSTLLKESGIPAIYSMKMMELMATTIEIYLGYQDLKAGQAAS